MRMEEIRSRHVYLTIDRPQALCKLARALASPVRVEILRLLSVRSMNVGELAQAMDMPMSTTALAVKTLEEAGLILTQNQPGARGNMKVCTRRIDALSISLEPAGTQHDSCLTLQMPIGGYSVAGNIAPTCGLADTRAYIGELDNPASFYLPDRFGAQILWMRQGFLEYRFAMMEKNAIEIIWLELSFEACSEAPMYRDPWKSDIAVSINGKRLGIWTSPCDCGGRHGKLTPAWWSEVSTQYGFLKTWRVDAQGSYLDNVRTGDVRLEDLSLYAADFIDVRIEVPEDGEHVGGINLFGERFGDYAQAIMLRIGYRMRT